MGVPKLWCKHVKAREREKPGHRSAGWQRTHGRVMFCHDSGEASSIFTLKVGIREREQPPHPLVYWTSSICRRCIMKIHSEVGVGLFAGLSFICSIILLIVNEAFPRKYFR
jgi:hypothetical protein